MTPEKQRPASVAWRRSAAGMPIVMAHRGAPTERAENTIASFRAALDAGAQVLEMDVRTTRDGELVVIHDATVDRTTHGHGHVDALCYAELLALSLHSPRASSNSDERICRLEEVLCAFPTSAMNVDLKAVSALGVQQIFAWIRSINQQAHANLRVLLTSEDSQTQQTIASCNSADEVALGMSRQDVLEVLRAAWLRRPPIERLRGRACQMPAHLRLLGVNLPLLAGPLPSYLRSMDCPLHVWWDTHDMVDDRFRLEKCKMWRVDGIFTNQVRAMASLSAPSS